MENNENVIVPNSPEELFAMQDKVDDDNLEVVDSNEFKGIVEDMFEETQPSPYQAVKAVEFLLEKLVCLHFNQLEMNDELTPWQRNMWKDDLKCLKKALNNVRQVNPDN